MSSYGPCKICGTYTSVGPFEEIICHHCSEDDEPYSPENTLRDLVSAEGRDVAEGVAVEHRRHGQGTVKYAGHEAEVEFDGEVVNVASDCLKLVD